MTASRLRDLIAACIGKHRDIDAVAFAKAFYGDRLGLTIRDTRGVTWRVHCLLDPWSRPPPDDGGESEERVQQ